MDDNKEKIVNNEPDFGLIELLSIFIRYRKFILIFTALSFLSLIFFYFIIPLGSKNKAGKNIEVVYTVNIEKLSTKFNEFINFDTGDLAGRYLKDYSNFAKIEQKYHIFSNPESDTRALNSEIIKLFSEGKFNIKPNGNYSFNIISILPEDKIVDYKIFINEYVDFCSQLIEDQVENKISVAEKNIAELLGKIGTEDKKNSDTSNFVSQQLEFQNYRKSHKAFITLSSDPFETYVPKGRVKKVIKYSVLLFICSLVIAFILGIISLIKADPKANKIIVDAWKAGK